MSRCWPRKLWVRVKPFLFWHSFECSKEISELALTSVRVALDQMTGVLLFTLIFCLRAFAVGQSTSRWPMIREFHHSLLSMRASIRKRGRSEECACMSKDIWAWWGNRWWGLQWMHKHVCEYNGFAFTLVPSKLMPRGLFWFSVSLWYWCWLSLDICQRGLA